MAEVSSTGLAAPKENPPGKRFSEVHAQPVKDEVASQSTEDSTAVVATGESRPESSQTPATRDSAPAAATGEDASSAKRNDPSPSAQDAASDSMPNPVPSTKDESSQAAASEAEPPRPVIDEHSDGKASETSSGLEASSGTGREEQGAEEAEAESQSESSKAGAVDAPPLAGSRGEGDPPAPSVSEERTTEQPQQSGAQASPDADSSSNSSSAAGATAAARTSSGSQPAIGSGFAALFGSLTFGRAPIGHAAKEDTSATASRGEEPASRSKEPLVNGSSASHAKPAAGQESDAAAASIASPLEASTTPALPSSTGGFTLLKSLQTQARHLVSQNKRRYQADGFDLDLSYITENIIAMGFPAGDPSSGFLGLVEGLYRNHMDEVITFLETHHQGKYKVFNLCSERLYDASLFQGTVACFPFDDHNCPPLHLILAFCQSALSWLKSGMEHVVVVHCKAGMGRTGIMIASLLLYLNYYSTAQDAIQYFNTRRAVDGKALVLPSQQRYVRYFEKTLKGEPRGAVPVPRKCFLRGLRLHRCPYWIRPAIVVSDHSGVLFSTKTHPKTKHLSPEDYWYPAQQRKGVMVFALPGERCVARLQGDFKISFLDRQGDFSCWLNANFLPTRQLLNTKDLDHFDKRSLVSPGFIVEVVVVDNDAPLPASARKDPGAAPETKGVPPGAPGAAAAGEGSAGSAEGNGGAQRDATPGASGEATPQKAEGAAAGAAPPGASTSTASATSEPSPSAASTPGGERSSSSSAASGVPGAEASAPGMGLSKPGESPSTASAPGAPAEKAQISTFRQGAVPTTPSKGTVVTAKAAAGEATGSTPAQAQAPAQAQSQPGLSLFSGTAKGISGVGSTSSAAPAPASAPQAPGPAPAGGASAAQQTSGHQHTQSKGSGAAGIAIGPGAQGGRGRGRAPVPGSAAGAGSGGRAPGGRGGAGGGGGQSAMGFFQAFGDALFGPSTATTPPRPGQGRGSGRSEGPARGGGPGGSARKEDLQTSALTAVPSRERTFSGAKAANLEGWLSPSEAAAGAAKRDMEEPMLFFSDGMKFQAGPVTSPPGTAGATGGQQGASGSTGAGRGSVGGSGGDSFDTLPVFDAPAATSSPGMGPSSDFAQAAAKAADASMFTFGDEDDEVDFEGF